MSLTSQKTRVTYRFAHFYFAIASYLFYLCKVQLAMQQLLSSSFRIFIDSIYACLCLQNKWGFLVEHTVSKRQF